MGKGKHPMALPSVDGREITHTNKINSIASVVKLFQFCTNLLKQLCTSSLQTLDNKTIGRITICTARRTRANKTAQDRRLTDYKHCGRDATPVHLPWSRMSFAMPHWHAAVSTDIKIVQTSRDSERKFSLYCVHLSTWIASHRVWKPHTQSIPR